MLINKTIGFLVILLIMFVILYWRSNIYKNEKFKVFFSSLSAIAIVFSIVAITIHSFAYVETLNANNTNSYNTLTEMFFVQTFKMFLDNPDMNYFYEDLMDIKHIDEYTQHRNYIKEQEMAVLIFSRSISIIYYIINNNYDNYRTLNLVTRFNHVMSTFFRSKTFQKYWEIYEEKLAGDPPRIYFKKEFNIKSTHWAIPSNEPEFNPTI